MVKKGQLAREKFDLIQMMAGILNDCEKWTKTIILVIPYFDLSLDELERPFNQIM